MSKRKKIALIFATGTVLSSLKNRTIVFVEGESDIPKWLEAIPEISLIADIEPHFFLAESATFSYSDTARLSEQIGILRRQVDGIVILMRTENIVSQAVILNFLNQQVDIPIIITGAVVSPQALAEGALPELSKKNAPLSLKSNLINATQVATRDFRGFGIMYGNRLVEPVRAKRDTIEAMNVFSSVDGKYAGRVEFGISLDQPKTVAKPTKHYTDFSTDILIIDSAFLSIDRLKDLSAKALIIKMRENEQLPLDLYEALRKVKIPVVLYNYWYVLEHRGLITVSRITEESLVAKVMWLVSEAKSLIAFNQKMKENIIGEFLS